MQIDPYYHKLYKNLDPEGEIKFSMPTTCDKSHGILAEGEDKGCRQKVRLHYMNGIGPFGHWTCPICGAKYVFSFWKVKHDKDYKPSQEEEADIRAFWKDVKNMLVTGQPIYPKTKDELIRIHDVEVRKCLN